MSAPTLFQWRDTITNTLGMVLPNVTVIILAGTVGGDEAVSTTTKPGSPLATIYADAYGVTTINQSTTPINTTAGQGTFQFWAAAGYYVVQAYGPGIIGQLVYGIAIGGGGGGGIGGTLAANQIGFGTASNTLGGSPNLTFNGTTSNFSANTSGGIQFTDSSLTGISLFSTAASGGGIQLTSRGAGINLFANTASGGTYITDEGQGIDLYASSPTSPLVDIWIGKTDGTSTNPTFDLNMRGTGTSNGITIENNSTTVGGGIYLNDNSGGGIDLTATNSGGLFFESTGTTGYVDFENSGNGGTRIVDTGGGGITITTLTTTPGNIDITALGSLTLTAFNGTAEPIMLPTTTGTAGQALITDGGAPQQTSWATIISGSFAAGQVAFASGTSALTGSASLTFSGTNLTVPEITTSRVQTLGGMPYINMPANGDLAIAGANTGSITFFETNLGFGGGAGQIVIDLYRTGVSPHGVWMKDDAGTQSFFWSNDDGSLTLRSETAVGDTLTSVVISGSPPSVATYFGTIIDGGSNVLTGKLVAINGFSNAGNNGTFTVTGSSGGYITVALTTQVNETHAATLDLNWSNPAITMEGSWWNGSAAVLDSTTIQNVIGTGPTPTSVLTISNTGAYAWGGVSVLGQLTATTTVIQSNPPASSSAAGVAGTITWDANYIYQCIATNTWKRTAISTW